MNKLQVYKATADAVAGGKFYNDATAVDGEKWLRLRDLVIAKKQPRKIFVQLKTSLSTDSKQVLIKEYEPTLEGLISYYQDMDVE